MAGIIPAATSMQERPAGRGLVEFTPNSGHPWNPTAARHSVKAHEFHYSTLVDARVPLDFAYRMLRGQGVDGRSDGIIVGNTLATYVHQRHTQSNPWITQFVSFIRRCKEGTRYDDQVDGGRGRADS